MYKDSKAEILGAVPTHTLQPLFSVVLALLRKPNLSIEWPVDHQCSVNHFGHYSTAGITYVAKAYKLCNLIDWWAFINKVATK